MKYLISILTLFLFIPFIVFPQCNFFKLYNHSGFDEGSYGVSQTLDNGFICVGNSFNTNIGIYGIIVVKTDACGDTLWQKFFDFVPGGGEYAYRSLQLEDSTYVICGWVYNASEGARDMYLLRLDKFGNIIWYKPINEGFNDRGLHLLDSDNGFFIAGNFTTDVVNFSTTNIFFLKTDDSANVLWQKNYSEVDTGLYWLRSFEKSKDGGYILGGDFTNPVNGRMDLFMLKTDNTGNFQWLKFYGDSLLDDGGGVTIPTLDKGFASVGNRIFNDTVYYGIFEKTDSAGNVQWSKIFIDSNSNYFISLKQLPDSSYIVGGQYSDPNFPNHPPRVWLLKLNSQGDTIWTRKLTYYGNSQQYGNLVADYVEDINITNDGGFIIGGWVMNPYFPAGNDVLLIKTDSLGNTCNISGSAYAGCSVLTSVVKLPESIKENIEIYPNPLIDKLNICIENSTNTDLLIIDLQGQFVKKYKLKNSNNIVDLKELISGVYIMKIQTDKEIIIRKIIKQ